MEKVTVDVVGKVIPTGLSSKYYIELDKIHLIVENGVVTGWYRAEVVDDD